MSLDNEVYGCINLEDVAVKCHNGTYYCPLVDVDGKERCPYNSTDMVCIEYYKESVLPVKAKYFYRCLLWDEMAFEE